MENMAWIILILHLFPFCANGAISGQVVSVNDQPAKSLRSVAVAAHRVPVDPLTQVELPLNQQDIYSNRYLAGSVLCDADGTFTLDSALLNTSFHKFVVVVYETATDDRVLDLAQLPAVGWYHDSSTNWLSTVPDNTRGLEIRINAINSFEDVLGKRVLGGHMELVNDFPVLRLNGTADQRGYAHGCLLGKHIVQHFRFFTLEWQTHNISQYENEIVPYVKNTFVDPPAYLSELKGVLRGMEQCGDSTFIPELNRSLQFVDLMYLNVYGTFPEFKPRPNPRKGSRGCSQLAAWGAQTADGHTAVGRNMDGENDFRKITVLNVVMFAVDARAEGNGRYWHVFWPGFVTTASGMNEDGIHVMMNDGSSSPDGPIAYNVTADGWVQREILARARTLQDIPSIMSTYKSTQGGVCGNGCNLMFAQAHTAGNEISTNTPTAMVYEGDRLNGVFRQPNQAPPFSPKGTSIMVTNHYLIYGYSPLKPLDNFGEQVYFSSLWRYAAGSNKLNYWDSSGTLIGFAEMVDFLQAVNHGTTEHSVITFPNTGDFAIAVADMRTGGWFAPFMNFTRFKWVDLFR